MISESNISFHVLAWDGWSHETSLKNDSPAPVLLRRRISSIGQKALQGAWNIPYAEQARYIFSSRHGEFSRTADILNSYLETAQISPADFSLSVHHALIGLLSMATKNRENHTALGAGADTLCLAFMEAYALLKQNPDKPVLIVHCDEPLGGAYEIFNEASDQVVTLAILLGSQGGVPYSLKRMPIQANDNSDCHALAFLDFLEQETQSELRTMGDSATWHWVRA